MQLYRHWYARMDTYREVRSMILVALPCPPLPVIACRPVDGESSFVAEQYVISDSHDLLAHLLNIRAACLQTQVDTERELLQRQACDKLVQEFDKWAANKPASADPYGYLPPVETSYSFFCHFIREYVATFTRCKGLPDIRMPNVADIGREHSVAKNAIRFAKVRWTSIGLQINS